MDRGAIGFGGVGGFSNETVVEDSSTGSNAGGTGCSSEGDGFNSSGTDEGQRPVDADDETEMAAGGWGSSSHVGGWTVVGSSQPVC